MRTKISRRASRLALRGVLAASVVALPLGAPSLSRPAMAQANASIGVVDGVKINDNFTKLKAALEAIEARKQSLRLQLDGRAFLPAADAGRFDVLIVKADRTPAETTELEGLAKKGNDRRAEFSALVAKAQKTADDTAKIKATEDESQKTVAALQAVIEKVDQAVTKQEVDTEDQFRNQIVQVVEQIATEKKLLVVVGKQAVAWSAGSVEITDEVIARLNKA